MKTKMDLHLKAAKKAVKRSGRLMKIYRGGGNLENLKLATHWIEESNRHLRSARFYADRERRGS